MGTILNIRTSKYIWYSSSHLLWSCYTYHSVYSSLNLPIQQLIARLPISYFDIMLPYQLPIHCSCRSVKHKIQKSSVFIIINPMTRFLKSRGRYCSYSNCKNCITTIRDYSAAHNSSITAQAGDCNKTHYGITTRTLYCTATGTTILHSTVPPETGDCNRTHYSITTRRLWHLGSTYSLHNHTGRNSVKTAARCTKPTHTYTRNGHLNVFRSK